MRKYYLVCLGNEILQGKIQDTNTQFLAQFLTQQGDSLEGSSTIKDSPQDLISLLTYLQSKQYTIITSGGLGPTQDDLTKNILSDFFNAPLLQNEQALAITKNQYARYNRDYPLHHAYHVIPQSFIAIDNPVGFAPGLNYKDKLYSFPGVPREFEAMTKKHLSKNKSDTLLFTAKTFGIAESKIFHDLCPSLWQELSSYGQVSSLPHCVGVDIGVFLQGNISQEKSQLQAHLIKSAIAPYILAWGHESIEFHVIEALKKTSLSLSLAESCTGGLIAHKLTQISGSSQVFAASAVTYQTSIKETLLEIPAQHFQEFEVVSTQTALEMALSAQRLFKTGCSIGITGLAGPNGDAGPKKVGTVCIAILIKQESWTFELNAKGNRDYRKEKFAQLALYHFLQCLNKSLTD